MSFACLGTLQVPSPCKLFATACCPDKDLILLVSRLAGQDRISLWNYGQGSKIWEVNLGGNESEVVEVVGLAWSPDGQSIAIAQEPPQVTVHSIQDGSKLLSLSLEKHDGTPICSLTSIWWLKDEQPLQKSTVPDVFRRGDVIASVQHCQVFVELSSDSLLLHSQTGSAQSICRTLPKLDHFQTEASKVTATDLFAFQGSQTKASNKTTEVPDVIEKWPKFTATPFLDSLYAGTPENKNTEQDGTMDDLNKNSLLVVAEKQGVLHIFLDGSFPVGTISLGTEAVVFASRDPEKPVLNVHPVSLGNEAETFRTSLYPTLIEIPLIADRKPRDFGELSTISRETVSYILRVIKDMKSSWCGSESNTGARELGPKWVEALESRQRNQFGQRDPDALLDLTALLLTGRATDSLLDFLGSSEHMSERGIRKWETTMVEVLVKLREHCEYRISPACQRLYLVLEELKGWEQLTQFSAFQLSKQDIEESLALTRQILVQAASLTFCVRRELDWFKEFINWLKFETQAANPSTDGPPQPRHDVLEVNGYLTNSLRANIINQWFEGTLPQSVNEVSAPSDGVSSLSASLERIRLAMEKMTTVVTTITAGQIEGPGRNLDELGHRLASCCKRIFTTGAGAPCRSARVSSTAQSMGEPTITLAQAPEGPAFSVRQIIAGESRYLAIPMGGSEPSSLCLARIRYSAKSSGTPVDIAVALIGRALLTEGESVECDLLDADFFDDHSLIAVYQVSGQNAPTMGVMDYDSLDYYPIRLNAAFFFTQEELVAAATIQMEAGEIPLLRDPFKQTQELKGLKAGPISIALNGRIGRRVACILDSQGTTLQSFDMEGGSSSAEDSEEEEVP